jgi:hypothetical protein
MSGQNPRNLLETPSHIISIPKVPGLRESVRSSGGWYRLETRLLRRRWVGRKEHERREQNRAGDHPGSVFDAAKRPRLGIHDGAVRAKGGVYTER